MLAKKLKRYKKKKVVKKKTFRQMERHLKGVANHRRVEILFLIAEKKGISVDSISVILKCNFKTTSVHLLRLEQAGLVRKRNMGRMVLHELSPYGRHIHEFLQTFQYS
ncbi:MAG TPA: hypothetical protein DD454_00565 [Candidatus Moranbacteria bacterium]|nr:hypothetical protein [Candidatus Moranbacteria bacterium]